MKKLKVAALLLFVAAVSSAAFIAYTLNLLPFITFIADTTSRTSFTSTALASTFRVAFPAESLGLLAFVVIAALFFNAVDAFV